MSLPRLALQLVRRAPGTLRLRYAQRNIAGTRGSSNWVLHGKVLVFSSLLLRSAVAETRQAGDRTPVLIAQCVPSRCCRSDDLVVLKKRSHALSLKLSLIW